MEKIGLRQGVAFTYNDRARDLVARVDRTISALPRDIARIETREGAVRILVFRLSAFTVRHVLAGEFSISTRSGKLLHGQRAGTHRGLSHHLGELAGAEQDSKGKQAARRVLLSPEPLIPKAEARALAARLGALELVQQRAAPQRAAP